MTPSLKNKIALIQTLTANGWTRDSFGHYKKQIQFIDGSVEPAVKTMRLCRVKMKLTSCRFEVQREINGQNEWVKRHHSYYKNLQFSNGRVKLGGIWIGKPAEQKSALDSFLGSI